MINNAINEATTETSEGEKLYNAPVPISPSHLCNGIAFIKIFESGNITEIPARTPHRFFKKPMKSLNSFKNTVPLSVSATLSPFFKKSKNSSVNILLNRHTSSISFFLHYPVIDLPYSALPITIITD